MTLLKLFYFMNFFVRPMVKKWRQKCAKKCLKWAPSPPKTPFFCGGGMCSKLPMPKKAISFT